MLAEWSIPIFKPSLVLNCKVELVASVGKLLLVTIKIEGASCGFKLFKAELLEDNLDGEGSLHLY